MLTVRHVGCQGHVLYWVSDRCVARVFDMSTTWAADPSLIGWWKLDDGSGTTVVDSSSKGANGPPTQLYPGALDTRMMQMLPINTLPIIPAMAVLYGGESATNGAWQGGRNRWNLKVGRPDRLTRKWALLHVETRPPHYVICNGLQEKGGRNV